MLNMEFVLAQIFGAIALILICIGYFLKTKSKFMIIQMIGNFFYACAFLVVKSYVGAIITTISIFRCLYLYFAEKKSFKFTLHLITIFIAMYIATTIIFWQSALDLMPLISSLIFTLGYAIKNLQTMRYVLIIPNLILVAYNIISTTYTSALLDFIEVLVIILAIIKFHNCKNRKISKKKIFIKTK